MKNCTLEKSFSIEPFHFLAFEIRIIGVIVIIVMITIMIRSSVIVFFSSSSFIPYSLSNGFRAKRIANGAFVVSLYIYWKKRKHRIAELWTKMQCVFVIIVNKFSCAGQIWNHECTIIIAICDASNLFLKFSLTNPTFRVLFWLKMPVFSFHNKHFKNIRA